WCNLEADDVATDSQAAGRIQAQHLLKLRRRRVAYMSFDYVFHSIESRFTGLRDALAQAGAATLQRGNIPVRELRNRGGPEDDRWLRQYVAANRGRFDAIVGSNDEVAVAVVLAALDVGIAVPQDLAVIGFDDARIAACCAVPLTTVAHPSQRYAQEAFDL